MSKENCVPNEITIDGVAFCRKDSVPSPVTGNRAVVVVDRGWIFAGNVEEKNGRIYLHDAVWVFRWESIGFDGMIADPKSSKVTLKKLNKTVDVPSDSEIFRIAVPENWGK